MIEGVVFVHIPKTGGTSICAALGGRADPEHVKARTLRARDPGAYDSSFVFTVVRNPWDQMVSVYHHMSRTNTIDQGTSFDEFIRSKFGRECMGSHPGNPLDWIEDEHGNEIVDYIGRFEDLDGAWRHVCREIGIGPPLPARNVGARMPCGHYYTDETRGLVRARFAREIARFGYEYEDGWRC